MLSTTARRFYLIGLCVTVVLAVTGIIVDRVILDRSKAKPMEVTRSEELNDTVFLRRRFKANKRNRSSMGVPGHISSCGKIFENFPYTYQYKVAAKDDCQQTIQMSPKALPVTALASYPGSGNTWLRYLIQQATGKPVDTLTDPDTT